MWLRLRVPARIPLRTGGPGLRQRLHQHRQNIGRGDVTQRARDRFAELNVRVELRDQLPDERHVNRTRDNMNPVCPHVGRYLDLADDDGILGKGSERANVVFFLLLLRRRGGHHLTHVLNPRYRRRRARGRGLISFIENLFQHVDHLGRIGPFQLDEFAHHLRRRDVHLVDDVHERANRAGIFGHENAR